MKKENKPLRIMFAGASGTGKTTLANFITSVMSDTSRNIPFVSGSVSDLLPQTKEMPHAEMLNRDSKTLAMEDFQILNLRNKLFDRYAQEDSSFVSDRSFLDSAAYFIYKQADKLPQCEVEHFLSLCNMCLTKQCTHLVFVPFTQQMFRHWVTEDNQKRITSRYFQMEISRIMRMVLDIWSYNKRGQLDSITKGFLSVNNFDYGAEYGEITSPYGKTKVIILKEANLQNREAILSYLLDK